MGYTTDFCGEITVTPGLPKNYIERLNDISNKRNNNYGDGVQGSFDDVYHGKTGGGCDRPDRTSVPGVWNQWELENPERPYLRRGARPAYTYIRWNEGEKFYQYAEWLQYLIALIKLDHPKSTFDGTIQWAGEESDDIGQLSVVNGQVMLAYGTVVYDNPVSLQ
jgi:hypothetical protein